MSATVNKALISEITRLLVNELKPVQIVLFGSYAWGSPNENSDIDLLIIVEDEPRCSGFAHTLALRARRCLRGIKVPKDILIRSRSQAEKLRTVYASLECEAFERGMVLYG